MRCPGRGRKPLHLFLQSTAHHLEMRCPGRGRKLKKVINRNFTLRFGNEMPRKGTETHSREEQGEEPLYLFGNEMPRKGTETWILHVVGNPTTYLEMRCPGRGRKLFRFPSSPCSHIFGNEMPRKGTETQTQHPSL